MGRIESRETNITVAIGPAALREFHHHRGSVFYIEHWQAPHLPIGISRMRVVGELDVHRPAVIDAVLRLGSDLSVGQVRQERKTALCQSHEEISPFQTATLAVGTKSGVSVEA